MPAYYKGKRIAPVKVIELGGEYNLESVLLENGTQKMVATKVGEKTEEWQPNADMLWARSIFDADPADPEHKMIQLLGDLCPTTEISVPLNGSVKTSDGETYTNNTSSAMTVTHTWDDTNARETKSYKGLYKKVRWVMDYYASKEPGTDLFVTGVIYYCLTNGGKYNNNFINRYVEYIDFINTYRPTGLSGSIYSGYYRLKTCPNIDTSGFTTVQSLFADCYELRTIPLLNISNAKGTNLMFQNCYSLKKIPQLDTSNVTNMNGMFQNCLSLETIPQLDTSNVTNMTGMFNSCYSLKKIPQLDTGNATSMDNMFNSCYSLKTIPQLDMHSVTSTKSMFSGCKSLENTPQLNTGNVTNMYRMFNECSSLQTISQLDTSKVTNMSGMFEKCYNLQSIPQLDTSNVTDMSSMFNASRVLRTIPELDTRKVTTMYNMFYATDLVTIPLLDMRSVTTASSMFQYCSYIRDITLKNIKISLTIGSGTSYGHLLTLDSLLNTIKELHDNTSGTSTLTLTVGSANLTKLADVYVKLIDITDEMRAEDEFIDLKKPFEVCESTDEGAMLVTEYVTSKNWQLK